MTSGSQLTNSLLRPLDPPGRGIFVLEISLMPWSPIVMDCEPRRSAISNGIRSS